VHFIFTPLTVKFSHPKSNDSESRKMKNTALVKLANGGSEQAKGGIF